jgi:hypothetical protein
MARSKRPPELWLLLAVAPFFAACEDPGPEERHCVASDGVFVEDQRCEPTHPRYSGGSHFVFIPGHYYGGPGSSAGAFVAATTPGSGHAAVARGGFGSHGVGHGAGG